MLKFVKINKISAKILDIVKVFDIYLTRITTN